MKREGGEVGRVLRPPFPGGNVKNIAFCDFPGGDNSAFFPSFTVFVSSLFEAEPRELCGSRKKEWEMHCLTDLAQRSGGKFSALLLSV